MHATKVAALAAVVGINAAALEAPIPGYAVFEIEWNVKVSGGENITVNGTVQDAVAAIQQVQPSFGIGLDAPLPRTCSKRLEKRNHTICGGRWGHCPSELIAEGIAHLYKVEGTPVAEPGPSACGRVSCSWGSAIWWCNDNKGRKTLDSFASIADSAQSIICACQWYGLVSGQKFEPGNWNTIVRQDEC